MTDHRNGPEPIRELLADSKTFDEEGRAYQLLQAYFGGLSLETLRPLLRHEDILVKRSAVFVASELGIGASAVVDDVIPLVYSGDRHLQYDAMESVTVCCVGERAADFAHVVLQLENKDAVLRVLGMRLVSNAGVAQLEGAAGAGQTADPRHQRGLQVLIEGDRVEAGRILSMFEDPDSLTRKYGAIAVQRRAGQFPERIDDPDIRRFCDSMRSDR